MNIILLLIVIILSGIKMNADDNSNGYLDVKGGKIHYCQYGMNNSEAIIFLHGGPGAPSNYLNPLTRLSGDFHLILFDQLGCGLSDRIEDTSLMSVENYVEQIETLANHLKIKRFHLYGHSWGTILAIEYYNKYPDKVKSLIFSSPAISIPMWVKDTEILTARLPEKIRLNIIKCTEAGIFDTTDYQEAVNVFYEKYVARKLPWSEDINNTFAGFGTSVYNYMWGPSEFTATGTLKNYNGLPLLEKIKIPVLYIIGKYDEVRLETAEYYKNKTSNSELVVNPKAAHMTMHDNAEFDIEVILKFLKKIK